MPRVLRNQPVAAEPVAEPEPYLHKILLVGESNTGKTSLALRWVHNTFRAQTKATIGVDFHLKTVPVNDATNVIVQLWDVSGQERFSQMTRVFYGGAVGAVVTFDVTSNETFESVLAWKEDIDKKCFLPDGRNIPVMLLGTKSDLPANPVRSDEEMRAFCAEYGFVCWHNTSSKTGAHVSEAFLDLIKTTAKNDADIQAAEAAAVAATQEPARRVPIRKASVTPQKTAPTPGSRPAVNPHSTSPPRDWPTLSATSITATPVPTTHTQGATNATTVKLNTTNTNTETRKKNRKCFGLF